MKVDYSKDFIKAVRQLSGKQKESVRDVIEKVVEAQRIEDISNCTRMVGYKRIYRIRIGSLRAFLTFHVEIVDNVAYFLYLVPRGQAYAKKIETELKRIEN